MGYRVDYGYGKVQAGKSRKIWLCFAALVLFLAAGIRFWPEGRRAAAAFLLPGSAEQIGQAAEAFAQELREGTPVLEAVEAFCRGIQLEVETP